MAMCKLGSESVYGVPFAAACNRTPLDVLIATDAVAKHVCACMTSVEDERSAILGVDPAKECDIRTRGILSHRTGTGDGINASTNTSGYDSCLIWAWRGHAAWTRGLNEWYRGCRALKWNDLEGSG